MKAILCEFCVISLSFVLPVTIATHSTCELRIELPRDGVIHLETCNVRFVAIGTASRISQLLAAHLDAPCTRNGIRILHTLTSGLT